MLRELKKLDKHVARQIIDYLEKKVAPLDDPTEVGKALSGKLATFWRYRVGDYRIICHLDDGLVTVLVLRGAHRSKVYDEEKKVAAKAREEVEEFKVRREEQIETETEQDS